MDWIQTINFLSGSDLKTADPMGPRTAMTITFFDTYSMQVDTEVDKYGVYSTCRKGKDR